MSNGPGTTASHLAQAALAGVQSETGRLVGSLAGGAVRDLCHEELAGLAGAVRAEQARLESVLLTVIGEVDARGTFVHDGALTAGAWLRMVTRATPGEAAASVRTARTLRTSPGGTPSTSPTGSPTPRPVRSRRSNRRCSRWPGPRTSVRSRR
jgi:hypothetical protein